jgi:O-antigen ligase
MPQIFETTLQHTSAATRWVNSRAERKRWHIEYLAAGGLGVVVLLLLVHPIAAEMVVLVAAAAIGLPWAVYRTSRHPSWLLIVLVLIEAATASSFVADSGEQLGAFIRYPLTFLFVLPFLPGLWNSEILRKGGFRGYSIYLILALASAAYSILPQVSFVHAIAAILPFCALCVIAEGLSRGEDARRVMGVLFAGCGIVVAANYLALMIPTDMTWQADPDSGMMRFAGFFTEPNEIGGLVLATLGAGFGYWPVANRPKKALTAITMLGALVECVMADSRSPLIAIAIGCAIYLVFKYRIKGVVAVAAAFAILYCTAEFAAPDMRVYLNRGDVASFTGRQVAWDFAVQRVKEKPILGYGYEVEGQVLASPYFPGWDEVWNLGYQTSLHDGYVSRAVSLGVPALLFWLFITLRPALSCLFRRRDPWRLRSIVPLALLPVLILNSTESISDFRSFSGILMALAWTILECERLVASQQAAMRTKASEAAKPPIVRALQAGTAS